MQQFTTAKSPRDGWLEEGASDTPSRWLLLPAGIAEFAGTMTLLYWTVQQFCGQKREDKREKRGIRIEEALLSVA